jgi:antirestriction protein ArdC
VGRGAYEIAPRMGVTVKTQIVKGRSNGAPVYSSKSDSIMVPDVTRYRAGFGMSAEEQHHMAMLHETVHATMKRLGRPVPDSRLAYCREELVAEVGAWVVARRLGCAPRCHDGARKYLEGYWGRIPDRDEARIWVEREVAKAADFIVGHHSKGGWKAPAGDADKAARTSTTVCPDCGRSKHPDATVCVDCFPA